MNPPSAWAVAVRDNPPVGEQCWTFPAPAGPKARLVPIEPQFWGIWNFSKNKTAAKDLLEWLCEREQTEVLCKASHGCNIPAFLSMADFKVWEEEGPPKGTLYNYPVKPQHKAEAFVSGYPAPPNIAAHIYNEATMTKMIAKVAQSGQTPTQAIAWAQRELEGFMR